MKVEDKHTIETVSKNAKGKIVSVYVNKTDKLDNLFADRGKLGLVGPPAPIMVFNKTSNYVKFTVHR